MRDRLVFFLMLTALASGEPRLFKSEMSNLGHVLLVAEDGEAEAAALVHVGYRCALSHAQTLGELKADEDWARERAGWEIPSRSDDWTSKRNDLTVIGLGNRSHLAWRRDGGVVCIDPAPKLSDYFDVMPGPFDIIGRIPSRCFWDPAYGRSCENSLFTGMPLVLGDPAHGVPIDLGPNAHVPAGSLLEDDSPLQKEVRRWLALHQPLPVLGLIGTRHRRSPNWDVRSLTAKVDTIVVRPSNTRTLDEAESVLIDDQGQRVSAHYVVGLDGGLVQMLDERWTAWPDGLKGRSSLEDRSIVIQLVNPGGGRTAYTEKQLETVARLIKNLRSRWEIADNRILGLPPASQEPSL